MASIIVTGANGQLGSEIRELVKSNYSKQHNFVFTDIEDIDITNIAQVENFFADKKFDYLINCAAYTNVDNAETESEKAKEINQVAAGILADTCAEFNIKMIHLSTDYVYEGTGHRPYSEDQLRNPVNMYGRTKLRGEHLVEQSKCEAIILRTSWLYSCYGNNFVKSMVRLGKDKNELKVIFDQIGSPTYAKDLAEAIMEIIDFSENNNKFPLGSYNFSNEGVCSWFDFAHAIMEIGQLKCNIKPIETKDYPTPAKRPYYSVINKTKVKQTFKLSIPHWRDSLKICLDKMLKN